MERMDFNSRYRGVVARLNHAFAAGDEQAFEELLGEVCGARNADVMADVQRLSESLLAAMARFKSESRVATLAAREIPDARLRLDHVLSMTEQAAHRTLDLIELTVPLADATAKSASDLARTLDEHPHNTIKRVLAEVQGNAEQVRKNLTEVMLAQGFQDLTGQILRGVRTLVVEVEDVLKELARITGISLDLPEGATPAGTDLEGPAIPNVTRNAVTDQGDVDDLIAGLGI